LSRPDGVARRVEDGPAVQGAGADLHDEGGDDEHEAVEADGDARREEEPLLAVQLLQGGGQGVQARAAVQRVSGARETVVRRILRAALVSMRRELAEGAAAGLGHGMAWEYPAIQPPRPNGTGCLRQEARALHEEDDEAEPHKPKSRSNESPALTSGVLGST